MATHPKLIHRFLHQNPGRFLCRYGYADAEIHMPLQGALNIQNCLEEKQLEDYTSRFQNLLRSSSNKTVWYRHKDRHTAFHNRIECRVKKQTCVYGQLVFNKVPRPFSGERIVRGQLDSHMQRNEIWPLTQTYIKISSKCSS